ncbi:MAG: type II methionyl aminopeptidase [Candidatus Aenigmarchaeota archaeon]|nr:type II methionyl aminopeptidase [Candidatus Aenigmarchaeota archaeon]
MLTEEEIGKYKQAGKVVSGIKKDVLSKIRVGSRLLDIAEEMEKKISDGGARPAFPVNISINEIAAHFTPQVNDARTVKAGDLVKIDMGAHIDGYIADMAFTWCSEKNDLIRASTDVLQAGIDAVRPGARVSDISLAISKAIEGAGFGPIVNLTGHSLGRYKFHGGVSIPNIPNENGYVLQHGDVVALEPFVCETAGRVDDSGPVEIYQFAQRRPVRSMEGRKILQLAENDFGGLPFAKRWLVRHITPIRVKMAILELERVNALRSYPVLKNMEGGKIAQAEHTIIVADEPIVTTL